MVIVQYLIKTSKTLSDNTIQAEDLKDFIKILVRKGLIISKTMAKDVIKNPGRALEIRANVGTAFATKNTNAALSSLPEVNKFYHAGEVLYFVKFV